MSSTHTVLYTWVNPFTYQVERYFPRYIAQVLTKLQKQPVCNVSITRANFSITRSL